MTSEDFFFVRSSKLTAAKTQKIRHATEQFVYGTHVAGVSSRGCRVPCAAHSGVQTAPKLV